MTDRCDSKSAWQSIVIYDGVTIGSARELAAYLLFTSGCGRRISRYFRPSGRELLKRVALYLALTPAAGERDRDDALELILDRL